MYCVYLLKTKNKSIYTGSTRDIRKRYIKHKKGSVLATKGLRPLKLIFYCVFPTKNKALRFEKYLKSGSGQAFRNKRLK